MAPERSVKIGRYMIKLVVAHHWAIKIGETWYEIRGASKSNTNSKNEVIKSHGFNAQSGAGKLGGELVGVTTKSDDEIDTWIDDWLARNPTYAVMTDNCQKFVHELLVWVTEGRFTDNHRFNSADEPSKKSEATSFAAAEDGNAIANYCLAKCSSSYGPLGAKVKAFEFQAQAVAGPGFGAFADATVFEEEISLGNVVRAHVGLNANTGLGVRNGNLEAHLLGFGAKIGADGIEVNTPIGGVNVCSVM